jgi:molybdenum cofactor biosynthesis enzyme MoaA
MLSPKKYRKQLSDLGIEGMEVDVSTIDTAMDTLNQLNEMEKILKKIRYNVRADIRRIRLEYVTKLKEVDQSANVKKGIFSKKPSIAKITEQKKKLTRERNLTIATYDVVENTIDDYLDQIEKSRYYIKNSIQQRVG